MGIPVLFGIHCHQPVDNFKNVVDEIVMKSYKPFFEKVLGHEWFKFSVHFSGWLLDYLINNFPETYAVMKKMSDNGRIEFFTGGYYEPVLSAISSKDRIGQIKKLSEYIKNHFGQSPKGLWLTERVWDPSIIADVAECKVEYMLVDDYHFISLGFHKDSLYGYYNTEQDGIVMKLFPIDQKLRYMVPFKEPEVIKNYLDEAEKKEASGAFIFDDGEKFGVWPKTYKWVYEDGWFDRFLNLFENSEHRFELYEDFSKAHAPEGFGYLPLTSYMEMGEWSLFADKFIDLKSMKEFLKDSPFENNMETFVKGAIWKNFLVKYPECNYIHKRMMNLSLNNNGDEKLTDLIYKAQCNDVLWHGIFGGIYLPNLRDNAYNYLIEAEKIIDSQNEMVGKIYDTDIFMDGFKQVIINTKDVKYLFNTKVGGSIVSLDIKNYGLNLLNTMSRRFEGYHKQLLIPTEVKDGDTGISTIHEMSVKLGDEIKDKIAFDWYNRQFLIDHFIDSYDFLRIKRCEFREMGDFVNKPFEYKFCDNGVSFKRDGGVYKDKKYQTVVDKYFEPSNEDIFFKYDITTEKDHIFYALELNFHFFDNESVVLNDNLKEGIFEGQSKFEVSSIGFPVRFFMEFDNVSPDSVIFYRVETVSQSESGADLTLQGWSLNFIFNVEKRLSFSGRFGFIGG